MKKSPLRKVSQKQARELKKRSELKRELIEKYGEHCMTCQDKNRDFRGISLSHIVALGQLGKTTQGNCLLECYICHEKYEKHAELRPIWQQKQAGLI